MWGGGRMKVYKNPFVIRESYFVKTGKGHSYKMEAPKSKGYIVEFLTASGKFVRAVIMTHI